MSQVVVYNVEELSALFVSFIPVGLLLGAIPLLIGYMIWGILKIFTRA